jgi:hypothetical protein
MSDLLQPMSPFVRRLAAVACFFAALLCSTLTVVGAVALSQSNEQQGKTTGLLAGTVVWGSIAATCWFMAIRLWFGGPAYRVTALPLWFIELIGAAILGVGLLLTIGTRSPGGLGGIAIGLAMLSVRWTVWRNRREETIISVDKPANAPPSGSDGITAREPDDPVSRRVSPERRN